MEGKMRVVEISRDSSLPGWRAILDAVSSGRPVRASLRRADLSVVWELESLDGIPAAGDSRVGADTTAHEQLEFARQEAEAALTDPSYLR